MKKANYAVRSPHDDRIYGPMTYSEAQDMANWGFPRTSIDNTGRVVNVDLLSPDQRARMEPRKK